MRRYRKISVCIWNDAKFVNLSDDAQLVFFFVLTHPHMTALGAMRTTVEGLAAEKGWPLERLSKAFGEICAHGMIEFDRAAKCLILPKFIKHNKPESPNVITGWLKAIELIPECELKHKQMQYIKPAIETMGEKFQKTFESLLEGLAKPSKRLRDTGSGAGTEADKDKSPPPPSRRVDPVAPSAPPAGGPFSIFASKPKNGHFKNHTGNWFEPIKALCESIAEIQIKECKGKRFNPYAFVQQQINKRVHPGAIHDALDGLLKMWGSIDDLWAYAAAIIKTKNGNWNEKDTIAEAEKFKVIWADPQIQRLAACIGQSF